MLKSRKGAKMKKVICDQASAKCLKPDGVYNIPCLHATPHQLDNDCTLSAPCDYTGKRVRCVSVKEQKAGRKE